MPKSSYKPTFLRRLLIWGGPITIILLMVVVGFAYWVFTSSSGARWALVTTARIMDGEVKGVKGTFLNGLSVDSIKINTDELSVDAHDVYLKTNWQQLLNRHVHIQEISLESLNIDLNSSDDKPQEETGNPLEELGKLELPQIPVSAQIDKLYLGYLEVKIDDQPLDFNINKLDLNFDLNQDNAHLGIKNIDLNYFISTEKSDKNNIDNELENNLDKGIAHKPNTVINTRLNGDIGLLELKSPWNTNLNLEVISQSLNSDFLCANAYLDSLPISTQTNCEVAGFINAKGSLQDATLETMLHGQGMRLFSNVNAKPLDSFPLRNAILELDLADQSGLLVQLDWKNQQLNHYIDASLNARDLNISALLKDSIPSFVLNTDAKLNVGLDNDFNPLDLKINVEIKPNTIWNEQDLNGQIIANADITKQILKDLDLNINLGDNHIKGLGDLGSNESKLDLNINVPELSQLWSGIDGGVTLNAILNGSVSQHNLRVKTEYTPKQYEPNKIGLDKAQAQLDLSGSLSKDNEWHGVFSELKMGHAGIGIANSSPIPLNLTPNSSENIWHLGSSNIDLYLNQKTIFKLQNEKSSGNKLGHWRTKGKIAHIDISQELIDNIEELLNIVKPANANAKIKDRGGIKVLNVKHHDQTDLVLGIDWDLGLSQALSGKVSMHRIGGDIMIPGDEPEPLGLNQLDLDINITAGDGGTSSVNALFKSNTNKMGGTQVNASTVIHNTEDGLIINPSDNIKINIKSNIDDLAWLSIFTGDDLQFSGILNADINVNANINGDWSANGSIIGDELRIIRLDDGMRLINGRLNASINNTIFNLNELYFPASLRVIPQHQRLANWLTENDESKNGSLKASGKFDLNTMVGDIKATIDKFPVIQRSDRFTMISGDLDINASLDLLDIGGRITVDAGWVNIDMLSGIDGVDSDVVVVYDDEPITETENPMNISMSVVVMLGDRLYLTGFGLNSGLTGGMRVTLLDNKLSGLGAIRTRGGSIQAYGQRLQIRRGTITFQGDISNPLLDIEALRTGLSVEAGVKVAGTAKKPRIDLISYPEVSDVEKLSWLLFGHGPDEAGGDMALLVSVGTSFLGDGEPFYRKFGIDEVSLKAGEVGTVGSILPVESVVSGLARDTSELENQFISITKRIRWGFTVGLQQAMSDTGTVATVSYRLMRGLNAELSVGTNNGLALIYRWFSR